MKEIKQAMNEIEDLKCFDRQPNLSFGIVSPYDIQNTIGILIEVLARFRAKQVLLLAVDYLHTYAPRFSADLRKIHPGYLSIIVDQIEAVMSESQVAGTRLVAAMNIVFRKALEGSLYFYSVLGKFIKVCTKYYLHDYCEEFVLFPRILDSFESPDDETDLNKTQQAFMQYLLLGIEINMFFGKKAEAEDFSNIISREEQRGGQKKEFFQDFLKAGRGTKEKFPAKIERLISVFEWFDEKELQKLEREWKEECSGQSGGLLSAVKGQGDDENKEMAELYENLMAFLKQPSPELSAKITSNPQSQKFGITWQVLQRVYFREVIDNFKRVKDSYTNYPASKLLIGVKSEVAELPQFVRCLCKVAPSHQILKCRHDQRSDLIHFSTNFHSLKDLLQTFYKEIQILHSAEDIRVRQLLSKDSSK